MMKLTIPESIKGSISEENDAKAFLKEVSDRYAINEKVETSTILSKITTMRHNGKGSIREYILEMSNLAARLKALKLEMPEGIVVQLALNSLPVQYDTLKVSYNTQKEKWSLHELLAQCVQEEERLKIGKIESAHLTSTSSDPGNKKRKRTTKVCGRWSIWASGTKETGFSYHLFLLQEEWPLNERLLQVRQLACKERYVLQLC